MLNYTKLVHFYMLITVYTETKKKIVEKFVNNLFYGENTHLLYGHMLYVHIGIASMRRFKHLKLPISIKIPVTIWQIVHIYMKAISPNLIS